MQLGKYNITLKNIRAYIQGNIRYYSDKYGPAFMQLDEHLKEQVAFREAVSNPECLSKGECKCSCAIPEMFYADKMCEENCYPEMMDQDTWSNFKKSLIEDYKVVYPFDWQSIVGNMVISKQRLIIKKEDADHDAGNIKQGSIINHVFNLNDENITIDYISTSCYCTKATFNKTDNNIQIIVEVDTKDKNKGKFESLITVNYTQNNESKLIFMNIKANLI